MSEQNYYTAIYKNFHETGKHLYFLGHLETLKSKPIEISEETYRKLTEVGEFSKELETDTVHQGYYLSKTCLIKTLNSQLKTLTTVDSMMAIAETIAKISTIETTQLIRNRK